MAEHLTTGAGTITAVLPNGRIVWLHVKPPLATELSIERVARLAELSAQRRIVATRAVSSQLRSTSSALVRDSARVMRAHVRRNRAARRRLLKAYGRLDRRFAKAARKYRKFKVRERRVIDESARRLGNRSLWDAILMASAPPLFAAYGERGRPFGSHNLTLALSLLVWLVGDEVVDAMFGREHKSPYPLEAPDTWSYIAPFGNVLGGWWLLDGRQHERFVTGRTPLNPTAVITPVEGTTRFAYRYTAAIDLTSTVAEEHAPDFATFTGVPAVAGLASIKWTDVAAAQNATIENITANVIAGVLYVTVTAEAEGEPDGGGGTKAPNILTALDAAWLVDSIPSAASGE